MSNPPGTHDDVLTVVGMIVADLTDSPEMGGGAFSNPRDVYAQMQARQLAAGGPGMGGSLLNPACASRRTAATWRPSTPRSGRRPRRRGGPGSGSSWKGPRTRRIGSPGARQTNR